jgi:group I intron endonuclease
MSISGIYKIINKVNGKYYVGSSVNIKVRWQNHKTDLNRNVHRNIHLQRSWNECGKNNFDFVIVEKVNVSRKNLLLLEQKYLNIARKDGKEKCYNFHFQANGGDTYSSLSEERKKIFKKKSVHYGNHKLAGKNHPNFDHKEYMFYNRITKEKFEGTRYDFCKKYKIKSCIISQFIKEKWKQYKKWIIVSSFNEIPPESFSRKLQDSTHYHFINNNTNEEFIGTKKDLQKKLNSRNVYSLFLNTGKKSVKGWTVIPYYLY